MSMEHGVTSRATVIKTGETLTLGLSQLQLHYQTICNVYCRRPKSMEIAFTDFSLYLVRAAKFLECMIIGRL